MHCIYFLVCFISLTYRTLCFLSVIDHHYSIFSFSIPYLSTNGTFQRHYCLVFFVYVLQDPTQLEQLFKLIFNRNVCATFKGFYTIASTHIQTQFTSTPSVNTQKSFSFHSEVANFRESLKRPHLHLNDAYEYEAGEKIHI